MLLHTKAKLFSLHQKMEILNEGEELVYEVESKVLSIHDTTYIRNAQGQEIGVLTHKPVSLHETHKIELANGEEFEIRTELFHVMKDVINIDSLGWQLQGDILQHDYQLADGMGNIIATAHHKWVSVHDVYYIDVIDEAQIDRIICVYVALEKIIRERENRRNQNTQNN